MGARLNGGLKRITIFLYSFIFQGSAQSKGRDRGDPRELFKSKAAA